MKIFKDNNSQSMNQSNDSVLFDLRKKRDLLKITGGPEKDIQELEEKIQKLEEQIRKVENEEKVENSKLSIEEKLNRMSNIIIHLTEQKNRDEKEIDSLLKMDIDDPTVKDEIIKVNGALKAKESEITEAKKKYELFNQLNNSIVSFKSEQQDISDQIDQLYQQYQVAIICREDRIPIENCIKDAAKRKKELDKMILEAEKTADEIDIPEISFVGKEGIKDSNSKELPSFEKTKECVLSWIEKHNLFVAVSIFIVLLIVVIAIFNTCKANKETAINETSTTTTYTTTVTVPTTVTTVPTTTKAVKHPKRKVKKVKKSSKPASSSVASNSAASNSAATNLNNNYSSGTGKGGGSSSYYESYTPKKKTYKTYDKKKDKDMSSVKDSKKDQGKTGGNKGYKATISNKKASPVPEKIFEKEHPLPTKVSKKEISTAPTVKLTPKTQPTTIAKKITTPTAKAQSVVENADNIPTTVTNTVDKSSE